MQPTNTEISKIYNILTCPNSHLSHGKHAPILWFLNVFSKYILVEKTPAREAAGEVAQKPPP